MDENTFFKTATLKICGNLEIEQALFDCLGAIDAYIPVDGLYLQYVEKDLNSLRVIAKATAAGGESIDVLMPLVADARKPIDYFTKSFQDGTLPSVVVFNHPETDPLLSRMVDFFGGGISSSLMLLFLSIENTLFGSLALQVKGNDRFNTEHARLFGLLKEPFAIALSNARKHLETVKLKDLLADDNRYLQQEMLRLSGNRIIGEDFGLKAVIDMVRYVARHDSPVLLQGETGVGKDVIANAIHYSSPRSAGPFITVNCGAIPGSLLDSELFGHEKGAFTGALGQKRGRFERAQHGTIFLDEVGELPPDAQVRLLRVLQHKEIERVGGSETIAVDIRIIAATNRNLESMVKTGRFREDLWFRLNVFPIFIPPLRERVSDIPALVDFLLEKKARQLKLPAIPPLADDAINGLMEYSWPGNVRELENIMERALILNPKGPLRFDSMLKGKATDSEMVATDHRPALPSFRNLTRDYFRSILDRSKGRINGSGGAAELTGLNPSTLRNKLKKLGLNYSRAGAANQS